MNVLHFISVPVVLLLLYHVYFKKAPPTFCESKRVRERKKEKKSERERVREGGRESKKKIGGGGQNERGRETE